MNKLIKESKTEILKKVELREKKEQNYTISIFSIEINDELELLTNWEIISREIAFIYQNKILQNDIEIWNIYLIFICKEEISNSTKYLIENNKFSSRKIVINKDSNYKNIENLINDKLFNLELHNQYEDYGSKTRFINIIDSVCPKLFNFLEYENVDQQFHILLEELI